MPMLPQNSRDQAPPASTAASHSMVPRSVTTPLSRPAVVSNPRAAHPVTTTAPNPPRRLGHQRHRELRLGSSVIVGIQRAGPTAGGAGHQFVHLVRAENPAAHLPLPRGVEPRLISGDLARGLAQIAGAGAGKADLGADAFGHAVPLAQAFDRQRHLGEVAPLGAAKSPVARGLLAGQPAFLHQHRRDTLFGQMRAAC
jgi:hypothetical protein